MTINQDGSLSINLDQLKMLRQMIDTHMRRNIHTFSSEELDAGWEFIGSCDAIAIFFADESLPNTVNISGVEFDV
jgi:hypothetical protein